MADRETDRSGGGDEGVVLVVTQRHGGDQVVGADEGERHEADHQPAVGQHGVVAGAGDQQADECGDAEVEHPGHSASLVVRELVGPDEATVEVLGQFVDDVVE